MKKVIRMVVAGFLCVATVFAITKQLGTDKLEPIELRCEYLVNPLGIDVVQPRFSWRLEGSGQRSEVRAQKQGAYRVLVASSLEKLEQNQGDLWDTGKVESDRSTHLVYNGEALISHMQCFWTTPLSPHESLSGHLTQKANS